jgi:predicted transcriptional regulator
VACVNPDGTVEPVARAVLLALRSSASPEGVARQVRLPLYRVRSSLRELAQAGLVEERGGTYGLTEAGRTRAGVQS